MSEPMKAMVLAAGYGSRLLPYTKLRPKPLFPILGRPLLTIILERLRESGFTSLVVNTHHLGKQIADLLAGEKDVVIQEEKEILGTGGALRRALDFFGEDPFLVVNADIYHEIDFRAVYDLHVAAGNLITLVVHNFDRFNKVALAKDGRIRSFAGSVGDLAPDERLRAFTGVHVVQPEVLSSLVSGRFSDIIEHYSHFIEEGGEVQSHDCTGVNWWDIGTPADYLALHGALLKEGRFTQHLHALSENFFFAEPTSVVGKNGTFADWGLIGRGAVIGDNAHLERVVVWDGARVEEGAVYKDTIIC